MKLLIVEDEQLLVKQLKRLLATIDPEANIAGECNSIESTVQWLKKNEAPDIIFMDIELADGQCFEIFNKVDLRVPIIFTTAYDEYALKAFKVNSIDYLLKPIQQHELMSAINKYKLVHEPLNYTTLVKDFIKTAQHKERFLVKLGQKMVSVNTADIAIFSARNTLNYILTKSKQKFVIDHTLDEVEKMVDPKNYFRANRQYIVSHDIISAVHPWFNGKLKLETSVMQDEEIIVSRERAASFKEWMGA